MMDSIDQWATQRVLEGCRRYGVIDLAKDKRCFLKESTEELLDALNYLRWAYEKGTLPQKDWMSIDAMLRWTITLIEKSCRLGKEDATENNGLPNL